MICPAECEFEFIANSDIEVVVCHFIMDRFESVCMFFCREAEVGCPDNITEGRGELFEADEE